MNYISEIVDYSIDLFSKGGIIVGFFLVFIECFIPILPLSVFVALNVSAYGFLIGCLISWIATSLGSIICYKLLFILDEKIQKRLINRKHYNKLKKKINGFKKITFTQLVLIITLPFTPSFLVNILSGITKMNELKFILSILIGKIFSILFWGYIGKSLIQSLTDKKSNTSHGGHLLGALCGLVFGIFFLTHSSFF